MNGGYAGKILRIDLSARRSQVEALPPEVAQAYVGGAGFIAKYLYDELKPGTDPLSPENKLIFAVGPTTGSPVPCASRMAVGARAPQTGALGIGLSGGHFPAELKFAGYDMVILEGKAEKPTYVFIHDDRVTFRNAAGLWGMCTTDTQNAIRQELGEQAARVACIGPAGEHQSCMAGIINERRAIGRRGLGAVMGAKNLKALVVRGTGSVQVAQPERFKAAREVMAGRMKNSGLYSSFRRHGTSALVNHIGSLGLLPARNWKDSGAYCPDQQLGMHAQGELCIRRDACYNCPVGCAQVRLTATGPHAGTVGEAEFESIYSLGSQVGVEDPGLVNVADRLCDELGLDTISAGVCVGFAMELAQEGLLPPNLAAEVDLTFGNGDTLLSLLRRMAYREPGLGDLLADGTKAAAQRLGGRAGDYAMHVKGLEMPGYDVRGAFAQGMNYATAYTGADHNKGFCSQELFGATIPWPAKATGTERKGALTKWNQDLRCVSSDCATTCGFIFDAIVPEDQGANLAELLYGLTGIPFTAESLMEVGERISTLARLFNIREGFTRADDTLPRRLLTEPLPGGASEGALISPADLEVMLDEYYAVRQWSPLGVPLPECLERLNLQG